MLFKSESLSRSVPNTSDFWGKVKFLWLKRNLNKIAKKYDLVLDEKFYNELFKWTDKRPMITFRKEDNGPGNYLLETKEKFLERITQEIQKRQRFRNDLQKEWL